MFSNRIMFFPEPAVPGTVHHGGLPPLQDVVGVEPQRFEMLLSPRQVGRIFILPSAERELWLSHEFRIVQDHLFPPRNHLAETSGPEIPAAERLKHVGERVRRTDGVAADVEPFALSPDYGGLSAKCGQIHVEQLRGLVPAKDDRTKPSSDRMESPRRI